MRLLREAHAIGSDIVPYLSAADFGDISPDELLVLAAVAMNTDTAAAATADFGIDGELHGLLTRSLVGRGYLETRGDPGHRQSALVPTERGKMLLWVALDGVMAARWIDFPFRQGDIVITTPSKSGTTWMQMICALLIFQTPDLPAPLPELSPWLDLRQESRDALTARLAAQQHRRFIKTHLPLDELPSDPRATYIVVARHPLDAAASMFRLVPYTDGDDPDQLPARIRESLRQWIGKDISLPKERYALPSVLEHLSQAWARRDEPNVLLVHYDDLCADLAGEMRRLAARLGITVPEATWPDLVAAATFEHMRAAADRIQPRAELKDNPAAFFWKGKSGSGRDLITGPELARYYARAARLAPPDLLAWLHRQTWPAS